MASDRKIHKAYLRTNEVRKAFFNRFTRSFAITTAKKGERKLFSPVNALTDAVDTLGLLQTSNHGSSEDFIFYFK